MKKNIYFIIFSIIGIIYSIFNIVNANTIVVNTINELQKDMTEVCADEEITEEVEIYQQVETMLDFDGVLNNPSAKVILENAALLPLAGMTKLEFITIIEEDEKVLNKLINGGWIIQSFDVICLHPIVRQIIRNKGFIIFNDCEKYCRAIGENIQISNNFEERIKYKDCAREIYNVFSMMTPHNNLLVRLFYELSDIYDELSEREASVKMVYTVFDNIDVFDDPIEKSRILSGTAYSLNNNAMDIPTLEKAEKILKKSLDTLNGINYGETNELSYIQAYGKTLSNLGSNYLAKSKFDQTRRKEFLDEAKKWHEKALEFREDKIRFFYEDERNEKIIKNDIATSYTTLATDYYYMKKFEEAIEKHNTALKIRDQLGNEKGKSVNQQRIIGCVIEMYRDQLGVEGKYIELALSFYPELIYLNYKHQYYSAVDNNMKYFGQLITIIINDRRLEPYVQCLNEKQTLLKNWMKNNEELLNNLGLKFIQ